MEVTWWQLVVAVLAEVIPLAFGLWNFTTAVKISLATMNLTLATLSKQNDEFKAQHAYDMGTIRSDMDRLEQRVMSIEIRLGGKD